MTGSDAAIPHYATLLVRQEDNLRWIVLNQPSTLNAFDHPQWKDLVQALTDAEADEGVGCIAIAGAGGNFSVGYNFPAAIDEMKDSSVERIRRHIAFGNDACWKVWNSKKPVIAAVQGYCLGGAFELALACDFVLTDSSGVFGEPECRIGSTSPFLITPWVVGMRHAKEILLLGKTVNAERAERIGFVNEVCDAGQLENSTRTLARQLSGFSADFWSENKRGLNRIYESMGLQESIALGEDTFVFTAVLPDAIKKELRERIARDGFSAALKWVSSRFK
ncbi:MAG: enoyl-CoA hydratase/isomerase family protein [Rhizobiales bacterium]|nr:enoyl-CoA hydratase/isomerase family protein [Hyphomicrobiales bacterium]